MIQGPVPQGQGGWPAPLPPPAALGRAGEHSVLFRAGEASRPELPKHAMFVECRNKSALGWQGTDDSRQPPGPGWGQCLLCGPAGTDRASLTILVQRGSTILNSDVRTEAVSMSQVGGPKPKGKLWGHSEHNPVLDLSPHNSLLGAGAPPYCSGARCHESGPGGCRRPGSCSPTWPISNLSTTSSCGSENRDLSSIRARGQVLGSDPNSLHIRQQVGLLSDSYKMQTGLFPEA